ncbi:helix-turn-helix transcriptional regulator [uncultured Acetobacteroides sp.]|uniref:response regulator transcription factor n=1 Tax=uncultured Acetobacteroides sp. TaxID=1760811 RepID=UPI0029F4E468|nr:helix-turn-helix transcriptional regulator [uncultured Acetobacteroides sp.]
MAKLRSLQEELNQRILQTRSNDDYNNPNREWLRPVSSATKSFFMMHAICEENLQCYHFDCRSIEGFEYLAKKNITVSDFRELIHHDDRAFFDRCREKGHRFASGKSLDVLSGYSLVFECRMQNSRKEFKRILFKYQLVELPSNGGYALLLQLFPLLYMEKEMQHRIYYVINNITCEIAEKSRGVGITYAEQQVLKRLIYSNSVKAIAEALDKSENTVDTHRKRIYSKFGVGLHSHAVLYALHVGLIKL